MIFGHSEKTLMLQSIMDKLTSGDARRLRDIFPYSSILEQCHGSRSDPVTYLSATFKDPIELLSVMFDTGAAIVGPRALNFFVPKAFTNTDWDFYVPGYKESVVDMLKVLQRAGVTWHFEGERIAASIRRAGEATAEKGVLETLRSWVASETTLAGSREHLGDVLSRLVREFQSLRPDQKKPSHFRITGGIGDCINILPGKPMHPESDTYFDQSDLKNVIIRGSVPTRQGMQPVRLIVGTNSANGMGCMAFLKTVYASHLQCFISGWCAAHMYYQLAHNGKTIFWKPWYRKNAVQIRRAVHKYRARGFEFSKSELNGPTTRSLRDSGALVLDFGDIYRSFVQRSHGTLINEWLSERRENVAGVTWTEFDGRVFALQDPVEAAYRPCRAAFTTHAVDLPLNRLRRMSNLVSLNSSEATKPDADIFRSSTSQSIGNKGWKSPLLARSGTVPCNLRDAHPWSWAL